jgi:hypothetical protein
LKAADFHTAMYVTETCRTEVSISLAAGTIVSMHTC